MIPFVKLFPELGQRETRSIQLLDDHPSPPRGEYAFIELYCEEPDCDCRRVLLQVRPREDPGRVLATISYGWESAEFYTRKLGGDPKQGREEASAYLDPLLDQSEHAPQFLRFFQESFLTDPDYVSRLQNHYRMFKEAVKHPPATSVPAASSSLGNRRIVIPFPGDRAERNPSFARLDELMQRGYRELEQRRETAACEVWIGAGDLFLSIYRDGAHVSLEAFDAAFAGTQFVSNWMHDLMEALHNAGLTRPDFNQHRVRLAGEFLEIVGARDRSMQESLRRELASGWTELGQRDRSDALYDEWLKEDPQWGWGWIGWADTYFHCRKTERNLTRARELLLQGLAVGAVRDREDLIERQSNIEESEGRVNEARALRQTADALRASRGRGAKPTPVRAAPTVGRNEPCPCGSGKKYKKCCGR